MKQIINFGMMRGGIHVYLLWMISNFGNNEVLFYNNIRNFEKLGDRLIKDTDTRIVELSNQIVNSIEKSHKIEIYSVECQLMTEKLISESRLHIQKNE